jgi:hypothetical protein
MGSAAVWPVVARAQQRALPVIGYLGTQSAEDDYKNFTVPFLQGLKESGYVEGQDVAIEYRYAENQFERLPALAADLVRRRVAVIVASGTPATLAAKAATTTIPIVSPCGGCSFARDRLAGIGCPLPALPRTNPQACHVVIAEPRSDTNGGGPSVQATQGPQLRAEGPPRSGVADPPADQHFSRRPSAGREVGRSPRGSGARPLRGRSIGLGEEQSSQPAEAIDHFVRDNTVSAIDNACVRYPAVSQEMRCFARD